MRVLFWTANFWPNIGGVGILASQLLPALRQRGHEFVVITPRTSPALPCKELYRGTPIYRFPFWEAMIDVDRLTEIQHEIVGIERAFRPDLVHIYATNRSNFLYHLALSGCSVPLLVTLHGRWQEQADDLVKRTLHAAQWVVGCSSAILIEGRRLVPAIRPRSSVVRNSVMQPSLDPAPLPFRAPRLVCLGRLSSVKGFDLAVTAFASVVNRFPRARLCIAGDGPERTRLEGLAAQKGVAGSVEFAGRVDPSAVPSLINSATIVVVPSRQEAFGLVALEAAWMGRPAVVSCVDGLPDLIVHHQTGLLVEKENSKALAEGILFLLEHPEEAVKMGEAARQRAIERYDWESHVDAYDRLYKNLARGEDTGEY